MKPSWSGFACMMPFYVMMTLLVALPCQTLHDARSPQIRACHEAGDGKYLGQAAIMHEAGWVLSTTFTKSRAAGQLNAPTLAFGRCHGSRAGSPLVLLLRYRPD